MIQDYQYIYTIYSEKSFTKAAKKLFISQPSLSASVKKIESQLGYQIFDRSSYKLSLTQEGEYYIEAAQKILHIEADLKANIDDLSQLNSGTLTIAGAALYTTCVFPLIIKSFSTLYPNISINFHEASSNLLYEKALKTNIDLIIDAGHYDKERFSILPLFEEYILLAIPSESTNLLQDCVSTGLTAEDIIHNKHRSVDCPSISPHLLKEYPYLILQDGHDLHRRALNIFDEAGFVPNCTIYLNQLVTAFHMAANGLGCTLVTDTLIKHGYSSAPLTYYKLKTKDPDLTHREVFVAYKKDVHLTHSMKKFIEISQKCNINM